MSFLRLLAAANLCLALLFAGEAVLAEWFGNPGVWSQSRIASELARELQADAVVLEAKGAGEYSGVATVQGKTTFHLDVRQDRAQRTSSWVVFAGIAVATGVYSFRLTDDAPWHEQLGKWLGICVLFLGAGMFWRHVPAGVTRGPTLSTAERAAEEAAKGETRGRREGG